MPKAKYAISKKVEVARKILEENYGIKEAAREFGICKSLILQWVNVYEKHGIDGLLYKNGKYSGDFRIAVVQYKKDTGDSARQTGAQFNVSHTTVSLWEKMYDEQGYSALLQQEESSDSMAKNEKSKDKNIQSLEEEIHQLKMENAYLKKYNALASMKKWSVKKKKLK